MILTLCKCASPSCPQHPVPSAPLVASLLPSTNISKTYGHACASMQYVSQGSLLGYHSHDTYLDPLQLVLFGLGVDRDQGPEVTQQLINLHSTHHTSLDQGMGRWNPSRCRPLSARSTSTLLPTYPSCNQLHPHQQADDVRIPGLHDNCLHLKNCLNHSGSTEHRQQ